MADRFAFIRGAARSTTFLVAVAATAMLVGGCAAEPTVSKIQTLDPIVPPMPSIAPEVWDVRGTLVSEEPANVEPELAAQMGEGRRAVYRSVSGITGAGTEVSGMFFVPKGEPPPLGWPVVSLAHGTTGLTTECAISAEPNLRGFAGAISGLLAAGVAVAATDYEGLGGPGLHPYLEPRTAGFNVIDAVRALRTLFPSVSTRWLAYGSSQGGQAVWAANELNAFYGGGLELVGSLAVAPAANITRVAELAYRETLTPAQLAVMPLVITGAERAFPAVTVDRLLHGETLQARDAMVGCGPEAQKLRSSTIEAADVKPTDRADAEALAESLRKMSLPQESLSAPMLVITGAADDVVLPAWVSESVSRSCQVGGLIQFRELEGVGHGDIAADEAAFDWVDDRFAGKPAPSNCSDLS